MTVKIYGEAQDTYTNRHDIVVVFLYPNAASRPAITGGGLEPLGSYARAACNVTKGNNINMKSLFSAIDANGIGGCATKVATFRLLF